MFCPFVWSYKRYAHQYWESENVRPRSGVSLSRLNQMLRCTRTINGKHHISVLKIVFILSISRIVWAIIHPKPPTLSAETSLHRVVHRVVYKDILWWRFYSDYQPLCASSFPLSLATSSWIQTQQFMRALLLLSIVVSALVYNIYPAVWQWMGGETSLSNTGKNIAPLHSHLPGDFLFKAISSYLLRKCFIRTVCISLLLICMLSIFVSPIWLLFADDKS